MSTSRNIDSVNQPRAFKEICESILTNMARREKIEKPSKEISRDSKDSEFIKKYQLEIDALDPADKRMWNTYNQDKKIEILKIYQYINENRYFSKSKPPIDLTYLIVLCSQYTLEHIRSQLKRAYLWLLSNPGREKKNYRRFITNFMEDRFQKVLIIGESNEKK